MKIIFEPKAYKIVKGTILLIAVVMVAYVAYAATNLTINNSGTVTISTTKNIQGLTFSPPSAQPSCVSQTTYSDTPAAIAWGNVMQGTSANGYICVKNLGGTGSTYSVSTSVAPPTGITVAYNGTSTLTSLPLLSGQTSLINVVVTVGLLANTGSFSYTTAIQ
jgi:hypothetical protein